MTHMSQHRGSTRSGLKASLQRKLHGLLVQAAIEARGREEGEMDDVPDGPAPEAQPTKRARRGASA